MDDLRKLLAEASPGPWEANTYGHRSTAQVAGRMASAAYASSRAAVVPMTDLSVLLTPNGYYVGFTGNGRHSHANAHLIVAAVNALPALLDVVEAAREHGHCICGQTAQGYSRHAHDCDHDDELRAALDRLEARRG